MSLSCSEVLLIRIRKVIDQTAREYPDLQNAHVLGVLKIYEFNYLSAMAVQPEDLDDDEEDEETTHDMGF